MNEFVPSMTSMTRLRNTNLASSQYTPINQSETDETRDELIEDEQMVNKRRDELLKTNLYRTRIIETEINSSLIFQTVLYFNYYYAYVCFLLQIFSVSFKTWVFTPNNISSTRIALAILWFIFELYRIHLGYTANIKESFYHFMIFKIFSVIFTVPCQLMLVLGGQVLPIDYATTLIAFIFLFLELILSFRAMMKVTKRQAAVYYLRNTQTSVITNEEPIKTSAEIEQELFYFLPHLKSKQEGSVYASYERHEKQH